jgi:hypothetical protein
MANRTDPTADTQGISGWAIGGTVFAAATLIMVGFFHAIAGFAAILEDDFYVLGREYVFDLDVTAWGWIHLLAGVLVIFAGTSLLVGATWARIFAIFIAMLSAVANFFFLPYYEIGAVVIIALDVWIIWSLTRPVIPEEV